MTGLTRLVPAAVLVVLAPALLASAPAHAAESRKDFMTTQAAVMAEVVHADGGTLPRKMTRKLVERRFGYELPGVVSIASYKRLDRDDYRICLTHQRGGWSTWSTRTRDIKASGRGKACRF